MRSLSDWRDYWLTVGVLIYLLQPYTMAVRVCELQHMIELAILLCAVSRLRELGPSVVARHQRREWSEHALVLGVVKRRQHRRRTVVEGAETRI